MKTIVPSEATVKVDFRLVHKQNPKGHIGESKKTSRPAWLPDIEMSSLWVISSVHNSFRSQIAQTPIAPPKNTTVWIL